MAEFAAPKSAVDEYIPGGLPPADLDPLGDGILMAHQVAWIADHSDLKLCEKGRRTGITFAEALDSTLIAATSRSAGGDNTWYIGDTKDKGREFIAVCARFAQHVAKELVSVEEFLFDDVQDDGSSRQITAWRIRFASGYQIAALSSRPSNIRGLQGRVVIDEAGFHPHVQAVIDACNALLIWGGQIRIISTHNGKLNAFNGLVKDAARFGYKVHRVTFDDAVRNGLYERVCLMKGEVATVEGKQAWYDKIRKSYGSRTEAMLEELDAIPREGEGTMLPLALIETAMTEDYTVKRWAPPADDFVDWPEAARRAHMDAWLASEIDPILERLPPLPHSFGEDFAMRQDRTSLVVGYVARDLKRHVPLIIELHRCPYDMQKHVVFHVVERLPRRRAGIMDANGNGMVLAQEARQKFGSSITELMPNDAWLREHTTKFRTAFEDRNMLIPADVDVRDDLHQFRLVNGVGRIPSNIRTEGTDGGRRHGDSGVALLNFHAATLVDVPEYGYEPALIRRPADPLGPPRDDDDGESGLRAIKGAW